jgi:hypothetical protein
MMKENCFIYSGLTFGTIAKITFQTTIHTLLSVMHYRKRTIKIITQMLKSVEHHLKDQNQVGK